MCISLTHIGCGVHKLSFDILQAMFQKTLPFSHVTDYMSQMSHCDTSIGLLCHSGRLVENNPLREQLV